MEYTDEELQIHELDYWINGHKMPFHHEKFYKDFFDFKQLDGKTVLEFGCGGCPILEYTDADFDELILVDPILKSLTHFDRYCHLKSYANHSVSILDLNLDKTVDVIIGFNVIDHFHDKDISLFNKIHSLLNDNGELWLYYDVRPENHSHHLSINNDLLLTNLKAFFDITRISEEVNPTHIGWSLVDKSIRLVAKKK